MKVFKLDLVDLHMRGAVYLSVCALNVSTQRVKYVGLLMLSKVPSELGDFMFVSVRLSVIRAFGYSEASGGLHRCVRPDDCCPGGQKNC